MKHAIQVSLLPNEFRERIERDLNNVAANLSDYLASKEIEWKDYWNSVNMQELLVGYCFGFCEGSYLQAFQQMYGTIPSKCQRDEIGKIIARRRSQIEHSVHSFLNEKNWH